LIGTRLGPYEITAKLGEGGMGEVYRATDTRLGREVAIKVLPATVANDADRLRRFEQEARAASALSHPNILTLFDVGRDGDTSYLVHELLAGESLRARLAEGALPLRKAIEIAIEVARGLAAAHAKGIVHRDLKPENLFLTRDGVVKILDFGLAKLALPEPENVAAATTVAGGTATGMVMGTVGYMAPEQVRGERADPRADLFALGCVLYEMASGRRAFSGATAPETLTAILREEPAPLAAPGPTGPVLDGILRRCLEKQPDDRFQSARDLGFALEALQVPTGRTAVATGGRRPGRLAPWTWLGLAALAAGGVAAGLLLRPRAASPASAFGAGSLVQLTTDPGYEGEPTFSPDGRTIAYVADRDGNFEIYLQQISGGPAINLTQNPAADVQPAFSPDGREIAFVSTRSGATELWHAAARLPMVGGDIWTMPALGGAPRRVVAGGNFPAWSPDGSTLVYVHGTFRDTHLATVPATGGPSRDLPIDEPEVARYFFPSFSHDGHWILFQNGYRIEVVPAQGGRPALLATGSNPAWGPGSTSVLFSNSAPGKERSLWRAPFDLGRGKLAGPATPITFGRGADLEAQAARDGSAIAFAAVDERLNLEELPFDAESGRVSGPPRELTRGSHRISSFATSAPPGSAIVYAEDLGAGSRLWRLDPSGPPVQLTFGAGASDRQPDFSPDGRELTFIRDLEAGGPTELWLMSADGGSPHRIAQGISGATRLADGKRLLVQRDDALAILDLATGSERPIAGAQTRTLFAVDAQSRWVVFQTSERGNVDLAAVPLAGGKPQSVVATPREDYHPHFSPSGRWLYFQPDHKNLFRVPGPAQSWSPAPPEQVTFLPDSDLFLEEPELSPDGKKLLYIRSRTTGDIWILRLGGAAERKAS